ncbi:MAG: carbamate kinase [Thermoanaerobaculia bacterium]|nr:carbamate kinase [Thermoanaerobaculia bacterium]
MTPPSQLQQRSLVRPLTLVAFGGNALWQPKDLGYVDEQWKRAAAAAEWLAEVVELGHDLLIVHGNGPQVGQVLIQMEEAATKVPPGTLDVAVAQTEGSMGYLLELTLRNRLREIGSPAEVATLLSLVVVDRDDPGFEEPTKPVGPFFSRYRANVLERQLGWTMVEDAGRGWRKVVASPRPLEVVAVEVVRGALAREAVVVAGGGGGIPGVRDDDGSLRGVEAVIDKDRTAALLARRLKADAFVNLTGVPQVMKNFGKKNEQPIARLTLKQADRLAAQGHFPRGSMGPKIEAAMDFVRATGNQAVITDIDNLRDALAGEAGTRVVPDRS